MAYLGLESESESSDGDMGIEFISPPRRPITRSVSAKRTADEIENDDDPSISPLLRPKKTRRVTGAPGASNDLST